MPKHRSTLYTVVREQAEAYYDKYDELQHRDWNFSCLIGTYVSLERAEEVAGAMMQGMRDEGFTDDEFRFTVKPVTFYEE